MLHYKLQSAMEYLMTYGWAILIIVVALGAIFSLNLFSPGTFVNNQCVLPNGFACISYSIAENGMLTLNLLQSTQDPLNVTGVACNTGKLSLTNHMSTIYDASNSVYMAVGNNSTFSVQCYDGSSAYTGASTSLFTGYIAINYTDAYTGFPNTAEGSIAVKIT